MVLSVGLMALIGFVSWVDYTRLGAASVKGSGGVCENPRAT